jgi:hypothetical protein
VPFNTNCTFWPSAGRVIANEMINDNQPIRPAENELNNASTSESKIHRFTTR